MIGLSPIIKMTTLPGPLTLTVADMPVMSAKVAPTACAEVNDKSMSKLATNNLRLAAKET